MTTTTPLFFFCLSCRSNAPKILNFFIIVADYPMMERPDIGQDLGRRCVGRTQSIEEAQRVAQRYEMEGFAAEIISKTRAGITVYEVWVSKAPDVFSLKPPLGRE
jgi:hypothetical protein